MTEVSLMKTPLRNITAVTTTALLITLAIPAKSAQDPEPPPGGWPHIRDFTTKQEVPFPKYTEAFMRYYSNKAFKATLAGEEPAAYKATPLPDGNVAWSSTGVPTGRPMPGLPHLRQKAKEFCSSFNSSGRSEDELRELGRQYGDLSRVEREETERFYEETLAELPTKESIEIMRIAEALPATKMVKYRDHAEYNVRAEPLAMARYTRFCESPYVTEEAQ
jgi:hypothetical protein